MTVADLKNSTIHTPVARPGDCLIDFESYSECDLKECGATVYAQHPSTEILMMSYRLAWMPKAELWRAWEGAPFPQVVIDHILAGGTIEAHNCGFERAIWKYVLMRGKNLQGPIADIPWPRRWKDTMATCAYRSLPQSLEDVGEVLDLKIKKDKRGKFLLQKLSRPQKPTKKNPETRCRDPQLMEELAAYCCTDCDTEWELKERVGDLPPQEYSIWVLDQKINDRGMYVDVSAVQAAVKVVEKVEAALNQELARITNGAVISGTKLPDMKAWLASRGCAFGDLTADTIERALDSKRLPPDVHRVVSIRQTLSRASAKKLVRFLSCLAEDGRNHGLLQYHGAGTGRWAGRLVQPQNFPRGDEIILSLATGESDEESMVWLIDAIKTLDPDYLDVVFGDAMDAIASALRGMYIAGPGNKFYVSDFSAIEARVTAWLYDEQWKLDAFAEVDLGNGYLGSDDMYCAAAAAIFGHPVKKKLHKELRQVGKMCFGADTPVVTINGVKPLIQVTKDDLVWDGQDWVSHGGLICQGEKTTIQIGGVSITPDHQVYLDPIVSVRADGLNGNIRSQALALGSDSLRLLISNLNLAGASIASVLRANAEPNRTSSSSVTCCAENPRDARRAQNALPVVGENISGNTPTSVPTMQRAADCSIAYHRAFSDATIREPGNTLTMAAVEYGCMNLGAQIEQRSLHMWSHCLDSMTPHLISTAAKMTAAMSLEISALFRAETTTVTSAKSINSKRVLQNLKPVYDIANAGPRHRFTILTTEGPLVVSNCELAFGYQGGVGAWRKFDKRKPGDKGYVEDEKVDEYKKAWRAAHPNIVSGWFGVEEAAIRAVMDGEPHYYGPVTFEVVNDNAGKWLTIRLPNGRRLWYFRPEVEETIDRFGNAKQVLSYEGKDNKHGGMWDRVTTYGGMLTENIVQAISRDLMVEAMIRVEAAGYTIGLTVHDEIIAEVLSEFGSDEEFDKLMTVEPPWAEGCPIHCAGWSGYRYHKE